MEEQISSIQNEIQFRNDQMKKYLEKEEMIKQGKMVEKKEKVTLKPEDVERLLKFEQIRGELES